MDEKNEQPEGRGMLDVMRYKKEHLDAIIVPLIRKTLVARPKNAVQFMHHLLGAQLPEDLSPLAKLQADNQALTSEVCVC